MLPETCRADLKRLINEKVVASVGYLHRCTKTMHGHTNIKIHVSAKTNRPSPVLITKILKTYILQYTSLRRQPSQAKNTRTA